MYTEPLGTEFGGGAATGRDGDEDQTEGHTALPPLQGLRPLNGPSVRQVSTEESSFVPAYLLSSLSPDDVICVCVC
jgi:hypothetical protein